MVKIVFEIKLKEVKWNGGQQIASFVFCIDNVSLLNRVTIIHISCYAFKKIILFGKKVQQMFYPQKRLPEVNTFRTKYSETFKSNNFASIHEYKVRENIKILNNTCHFIKTIFVHE